MASGPYGRRRSSDVYYQFGANPIVYVAQWNGMPQPSVRRVGLGSAPTYHVSLGPRSVLHSGPDQSPIDDSAWPKAALGIFEGLSKNEKRLGVAVAAVAAAWYFWKKR